jgi:ribosomal RNA-processing protein 12
LQVEECIGAAIVAMGPDKIHSLLPISFDEDWFTCSNTWLVPILSKYVYGASLQHFIEYIVPLAKSLRDASSRGKDNQIHQAINTHVCILHNFIIFYFFL